MTNRTALLFCVPLVTMSIGCTDESVRIALESQRRADQIQHAVFERQHDALRLLLYRDLLRRLSDAGLELDAPQRTILNESWNERDLIEFWARQHERATALRLVGVDAQLFGQQSIVDLLYKSIQRRGERARSALATEAAKSLTQPPEGDSQ